MAALLWPACDSGDGGGEGGSPPVGSQYGDSPCFTCVAGACGGELDECNAEPSCAGYLGCLRQCPVDAAGNAEASCVAACPPIQDSAGQAAQAAFESCRTDGAGRGCAECGSGGGGGAGGGCEYTVPVLCEDCAPSTLPDECAVCTMEECCESNAATSFGGAGVDLMFCWSQCQTYQCELNCFETYPDQVIYLGGFITCRDIKCRTQGLCTEEPLTPCLVCALTECPNERARCWSNPACYLAATCVDNCTSGPDCVPDCLAQYPGSEADFESLATCTTTACISACGG